MYTVLIVDDERDIRRALRIYLQGEGYSVLEAQNGAEALALLHEQEVQLILMDVMMPVMDGVETTQQLRGFCNAPVIFLTAKSEDEDKILGLTIGADDYVTKPFKPLELMARIKAQLRRYSALGGLPQKAQALTVGGIVMDDDAKLVTLYGEPVQLTPTEYDLLRVLMLQPGKVFSSKELYSAIRNEEPIGAEGTIAVHVRHLREKLEIDPANPRYLRVVWGKGYKLEG